MEWSLVQVYDPTRRVEKENRKNSSSLLNEKSGIEAGLYRVKNSIYRKGTAVPGDTFVEGCFFLVSTTASAILHAVFPLLFPLSSPVYSHFRRIRTSHARSTSSSTSSSFFFLFLLVNSWSFWTILKGLAHDPQYNNIDYWIWLDIYIYCKIILLFS